MASRKTLLGVICLFLVALALLVLVALFVGSGWDTFVPDLIIGVVGAGAIAAILYWVQKRADDARAQSERIAAAYEGLIDAITPLRTLNLGVENDAKAVSALATRMLQLFEVVGDDTLGKWFEAERQLCVSRSLDAAEKYATITAQSTIDEVVAAHAPLHQWAVEFGNNIRYWRTGRLTEDQMIEQGALIETGLRKVDRWRSEAMPWRKDLSPDE